MISFNVKIFTVICISIILLVSLNALYSKFTNKVNESYKKNKKKYKICIVMWYDDNIKNYADFSYEINKKYCEKHGYKLIRDGTRRVKDRSPHYERIPLINKHLSKYDYIIWIDADAHFYLDSPQITKIIENNDTKDFIFSGDSDTNIFNTILNNAKDRINTGVLIIKNSSYSKKILNLWERDSYLYENRINKESWHDQGVLRLIYFKNLLNIKSHSITIPYGVIQHFSDSRFDHLENVINLKQYFEKTNKPLIRHLAGKSNEDRYRLIKKYHDFFK